MDIIKNIFIMVLLSSLSASVLVLILMLSKRIFRDRIKPRVHYILWLLVFLKLIVTPFAPASHISIFNLISGVEQTFSQKNTTQAPTSLSSSLTEQKRYSHGSNIKNNLQTNYTTVQNPGQSYNKDKNSLSAKKSSENLTVLNPISVLSVVWLLGFLFTLAMIFCSGVKFWLKSRSSMEEVTSNIRFAINSFYPYIILDNKIPLYSSTFINVPCVWGILTPRILIPKKLLVAGDYRQLSNILIHEIAHFKRRDNLVNLIVIMINAINWFNPILWYASTQLKLQKEICCDTYALEILGQEQAISYGMTLITFGRQVGNQSLPFNFSSFCKKSNHIERRIIMIKTFKKGSYKISAIAIAACISVGFVTLTNSFSSNASSSNSTSSIATNVKKSDNIKFNFNPGTERFFTLDRIKPYADFDFQLPNSVPSGFIFECIQLSKTVKGRDYLSTTWLRPYDKYFTLTVSTDNLLESFKASKKSDLSISINKSQMKIGSTTGTCIVKTSVYISGKDKGKTITNSKDFVWQKGNVWYDISFYAKAVPGLSAQISLSEKDLETIVTSMRDFKSLDTTKYVSEHASKILTIYSDKDLNEAQKMLQFTPKFPLKIMNSYIPCAASVTTHNEYGPYMNISYVENNKKDKKGSVPNFFVSELKGNMSFQNIVKKGYVETYTKTSGTPSQKRVRLTKLNVNGVDTYYYSDNYNSPSSTYFFKLNNLSYSVAIYGTNKSQEIIKALIAAIK